MKQSIQMVLTASGVLLACAGVLFPIRSTIAELEEGVSQLENACVQDASLDMQLIQVRKQIEDFKAKGHDRDYSLCPDTPEARNEFENRLLDQVKKSGLRRVSMDRKAGDSFEGDVPAFLTTLVVEGDATEMNKFLVGLESIEWVTRVCDLEVKPGDVERRITMHIAVLLERQS